MAFKNPLTLDELEGILDPSQLPPLNQIPGTADPSQVPALQDLNGFILPGQAPNISALNGTLTNGQLPATITKNLIVGSLTDPHIEIVNDRIQIIKERNGELITTVSLGGTDVDQIFLVTNDGSAYGLNQHGDGIFASVDCGESLLVDGVDVMEAIVQGDDVWRGSYKLTSDSGTMTGGTEVGVYEIDVVLDSLRQYVLYGTAFLNSAAQTPQAAPQVLFRYTNDGSAPTTSSTLLDYVVGVGVPGQLTWLPITYAIPIFPGATGLHRILVSVKPNGGSASGSSQTVIMKAGSKSFVVDAGRRLMTAWTQGTLNNGGTPPTPPTHNYNKGYAASWSRTWQNGSVMQTNSMLYQGYVSGFQHVGAFGFGSGLVTDLTGSTINSMTLTMRNLHTYNGTGGTLRIRPTMEANLPASAPGGYGTAAEYAFTYGQTRTNLVLPSSWFSGFQSGSYKGFQIDSAGSTSASYYGYYEGNTSSNYRPYVQVNYTK